MPERPPNFRRGQRRLLAPLNQMAAAVRSFGLFVVRPLKLTRSSSGLSLTIDPHWFERQFARITAGPAPDHSYQLMLVKRVPGHSFADTGIVKRGWEMNDNQTIGGTPMVEILVELTRRDLLFQLATCP
jgi:hypothetical protein